jgi:hypothetical protein
MLQTLISLMISTAASLASDESTVTPKLRVLTAEPAVRVLLDRGAARSVTFRELLSRVERSEWLVFVQRAMCPSSKSVACLIHRVGRYEGSPYLLIRVDPRHHRTSNQEISLIAHELQHALEVIDAPEVRDAEAIRLLFRRIGWVSYSGSGVVGYETNAAVHVEDDVLRELLRKSTPTRETHHER